MCRLLKYNILKKQTKLTKISASKKTHFENCVSFQQCSFVNVTPNSGRLINNKFASSSLFKISTSTTRSNTLNNLSLKKKKKETEHTQYALQNTKTRI